MFERIETLVDDLRAFAADPTVAAIPFSFASHEAGAGLLQLAAGRTPASLESYAPDAAEFKAAQQFLAYVVFDPKNNYFTLLCVDSNAPDEAVKDNYRRLIALVHPDANPIGFPADAASRVNLGYAVLSNAVARAAYTESLEHPATVSAFAAKDRQSEPIGAGSGSRPNRLSPSHGVFAWIKRPRFGFGLLVLATMLILPVVFVLTNMAHDNVGERLVSGRERAEQKRAALNAESTAISSTRPPNFNVESNVAAVTENSSSVTRPKSATRTDNPIRANSVVVAATETTKAATGVLEQGAVALSNGAPALAATAALSTSPASIRLSLAPVPGRLLDQTAVATSVFDPRSPRVTAPPAVVDTGPHNSSGAVTVNPTAVKGQPVATPQSQPATAPRVIETRSRDAEDTLLRFGSAYEQGSIESVRALFGSSMPGRSQMIADYQRVFSNTRQRNIRFLQLKHTVAGQRVTTVGQAVVNTVGVDSKSSSQRVFLEIEVARDGNDVRIERMSNYALD